MRSWLSGVWRARQAPRGPRQRACRPVLETLEDRCLLAGGITEFPIPTGTITPSGITSGPDGALWFTEAGVGKIGRISTSGTVTEYSLSRTDSDPEGITSGPDGALWFTEAGIDRIGRIDPTTGQITEFSTGITLGADPLGITTGPDGALWFTEAGKDQIGRITTAGAVTEFSAGITAGSTPTGITTGPDGALWFTEPGTGTNPVGRVGRITTAGTVTEFSAGITAGSTPAGITTGPDGNLWFTEPGTDRIGQITTAGAVTEFSAGITAGSTPTGITTGPDGALWFTEPGKDQIGRITTGGTVTEFSTGITSGSAPTGITTGPDEALWFTEPGADRIGQITTGGTVTEFVLRNSAPAPADIVTGPDVNLWFTEPGAAKIGRILSTATISGPPSTPGVVSPPGAIVEYSLPTAGSDPTGITLGPDGALWFTEPTADRIGRITTSGQITEFSTGITLGAHPLNITTGPDGNLWFTEPGNNQVGRITPTGTVTEFSAGITAGSTPTDIVLGPDGNLWFTERTGNRIGRITTAGTVTEFSTGITAGSTPTSITAGPDSTLWFTQPGSNQIGRISTAGTITEFNIPTPGSGPADIALGPDGNLWFTETTANQIGRISATDGTVIEFSTGLTPGSGLEGITRGPNGRLWFTEATANQIGRLTPDSPLSASGTQIVAQAGVPFTAVVATFSDGDPNAVPGDFAVSIDWGDGTALDTSTVVVSGAAGNFTVQGTHTYALGGHFTIRVKITDVNNTQDVGGNTATAFSTADVTPIPPPPGPGTVTGISQTVTGFEFSPLIDQVVATFTFSDTSDPASAFSASIDWGDGTVTQGTVVGSAGTFSVLGTHTYGDENIYPVLVTVNGGASPVTIASTAQIGEEQVLQDPAVQVQVLTVLRGLGFDPAGSQLLLGVLLNNGANLRFLTEAYRDLLGRQIDAGALVLLGLPLDAGLINPVQATLIIASTPEFQARLPFFLLGALQASQQAHPAPVGDIFFQAVDGIYELLLHRTAVGDTFGDFWAALLRIGVPPGEVVALIAGTNEFYGKTPF